jgi:hypothetical protein
LFSDIPNLRTYRQSLLDYLNYWRKYDRTKENHNQI